MFSRLLVLALAAPVAASAWPIDQYEYWLTLAGVAVGSALLAALLTYFVLKRCGGSRHTQPPAKYATELSREERVLPRALGWIQESKPDSASEEVRLEPYVFEKKPIPGGVNSPAPVPPGAAAEVRLPANDSTSQGAGKKRDGVLGDAVAMVASGSGRECEAADPTTEDRTYFSDEELARWQLDRSALKIIAEIDQDDERVLFKAHHATAGAHGLAKYAGLVALASVPMGPGDNQQAVCDFIEDCRLLMRGSHDSVLRLIGISLKPDAMRCAVEYTPCGQLLTAVRLLADHNVALTELEHFSWLVQVSGGLTFLADKRIVHRNLSLRTCLLGLDSRVKIAGFKYSRLYSDPARFQEHEHKGRLPLKHFAPEVLSRGVDGFSLASDVWAFGILIAELVHGGKKPFREIPNSMLLQRLEHGLRPDKPLLCSEDLHEVMLASTALEPAQRPWASDLWRQLSDQQQAMLGEQAHPARNLTELVMHLQLHSDEVSDRLAQSQPPSALAQSLPPPAAAASSLSAALAASLKKASAAPAPASPSAHTSTATANPLSLPGAAQPSTSAATPNATTISSAKQSAQSSSQSLGVPLVHLRVPAADPAARRMIESVYEHPVDSSPMPPASFRAGLSPGLNASMEDADPDLIVPVRAGGVGDGADEDVDADGHGVDQPLWLHFTPSKKVIQQRLTEHGLHDGLFLVRTSRRFSGEYMLALCHGGQAHNYRIRYADGQFSLDKMKHFASLAELVDHYRHDPERVLPVPLLSACPRPDSENNIAYIPTAASPRHRMSATLTDFDLHTQAHA